MPIGIKSSGGGTTTLVATSSASNFTTTLPDNTGTIVTTGSTGVVTPSLLNTQAQYTGFKNRIINGAMVVDQRNSGASQTVTTSGAYTVDRFFVQPVGASVTTQQISASGQYKNALRITGATSVTQCYVQQKIEALNSYDLAGQTITVTIRASSSTLTSLTCYVERATAGVDNWSTFATDKTQSITINSTPTDYSFQATLSSAATNGIRFIFATGSFTSGTLDITGVQLEKGDVATSFDYRPYGTELMLCQRYYQTSGVWANYQYMYGSTIAANYGLKNAQFGTTMRTSATVVAYSESGVANRFSINRGGAYTAGYITENTGFTLTNATGGGVNITELTFSWTASAEL